MKSSWIVTAVLLTTALCLLLSSPARAVPLTGGTGPGGFDLTDGSSSLELWYQAGTIGVGNGNPIGSWTDSSGNGRTLIQAGAARPTLATGVVNSQPVARFNGSTQFFLYDNTLPQIALGSITVVAKHDTTPFPDYKGLIGSSAQPVYTFLGNSGNTNWYLGENRLTSYFTNGNPTSNIGTISRITDFNVYSGIDSNVRVPNDLSIGYDRNSRFWDGDVAEVIVHSRVLNSAERIIMENSLASKYDAPNATYTPNTTLLNDRYDGDTLGNGNFDFDVFGVGRVNLSNQLLSAGSAGMGIEVASLPIDDRWVLAGHGTGPNGVTTVDAPPPTVWSLNSRWERSWFVDTTGVASANLAFDWSDALNSAPFDASYNRLLFRPNNSGPFSIVGVGVVDLLNERVDFSGVALQDGFYTLGAATFIPEPSSFVLVGLGAMGLVIRRRRRKSHAKTEG